MKHKLAFVSANSSSPEGSGLPEISKDKQFFVSIFPVINEQHCRLQILKLHTVNLMSQDRRLRFKLVHTAYEAVRIPVSSQTVIIRIHTRRMRLFLLQIH